MSVELIRLKVVRYIRVWTSVCHGQKSWLGVLEGEVLIGELFTVDGLATGSLHLRLIPAVNVGTV